jgi:hypothetical protein
METPPPSTPFPHGTPDSLGAARALAEAADRHRDVPLGDRLAARGLGPYRGYTELLEAIGGLVDRGAELRQIGLSVRGEPLFALGLGPGSDHATGRTSVVLAGLHPLEWIGVETAVALAARLLARPLERRAWVMPIANPDGLLRVERNLRAGRRRFVRHNAHGVDLNRNFDAAWRHKNLLARLAPRWLFRPGTHAASEPEVSAIAFAFGATRIDRALSLHSFGGAVLYPSSATLRPVADVAEHRQWARRIAAAADARSYRALPCSWFGLGTATGGLELDWFHRRHGALSLLIECSRGGIGLGRARLLEPFAWFNPPALAAVASRIAAAALPFVAGDPP